MPVRVGAQLENSRLASNEPVRSRTDRKRVLGRRDASQRIFTPNDRELEVREESRVGFVEDEEDRARVGYPHLGDPSIGVRVAAAELRIHDASKGGDDISRI